MNQHDSSPPKWPLKILRFFVKKEYLEEIEGDMEELFRDNVEQRSFRKARRMYVWELLRLLRPVLMKNLEGVERLNQYGMFKNYFKVSFRGLMKNPLNSSINIFGLAIAIGICVFTYAFARWTYSTDQFHKNKNEVYLATFLADRDGSQQQYGMTPRPLGEQLRQDFAQIKRVCRVEDRNVVVKYEDHVFNERVRFTDASFLEMFTFPLKWGVSTSLSDANSIILSEKMSIKYFGEENPIGQSILVKFDKDPRSASGQATSKAFKITGVAQAFPVSHTIDFGFLVNFENLRTVAADYDFHDWSTFVNATLIQVDHPNALASIEQGMEKYKKLQNESVNNKDWAIASFAFEPLATLHERSEFIRDGISRSSGDNFASIIFLSTVSIFMLALACFNYINIAIVSAAKRLKEIGVRKTIGATRTVVIIQFLTENVVITFFALILGLAFGSLVVVPWFEQLWHFNMGFQLADPNLWIYLPAILFITGIASGIYPAFYISNFQVVGILKGSVRFGTGNPLTKVFLGIQLILACMFISSAVMFTMNSNYLAHRSWGYSQHDALYAVMPDQLAYEQLNAVMAREPNVVSISGSVHHLGKSNTSTILHFPDREFEADQLSVDPKYFETMGLELKAGRAFNDHEGSDRHAVVVNELLVKNLVWDNAIGKTFQIDSVQYEVIGVAKDFHSYNFFKPVRPTIFRVAEKADYRYLSMKVKDGSELDVYKTLQAKWAVLFPEAPFNGGFQEDVWAGYYAEIEIHGHVWRVFATLAVLLASLGLYGLVALNVSGRVREFSIRKVLGAGTKNIAASITNQYLILFAAALILGVPLSYLLLKAVFDFAYTYHMPVTYWVVFIAAAILVLVLIATLSTQISKVLKANPVNGLKVE